LAIARIWDWKRKHRILHDLGAGLSAFTSLTFNKTSKDQLRLWSRRPAAIYQVPNDPDQRALGIRDVENHLRCLVNFPGCM
jgi:hypothetical protein